MPTFGGVYVRCIYSHARWSYRRGIRRLLLFPLLVERCSLPLWNQVKNQQVCTCSRNVLLLVFSWLTHLSSSRPQVLSLFLWTLRSYLNGFIQFKWKSECSRSLMVCSLTETNFFHYHLRLTDIHDPVLHLQKTWCNAPSLSPAVCLSLS